MATGKRYFWMKLKESFMTSDVIDYFMEQPDGANYVVLYQMLCLKTINTNGRLSRQIGEIIIPYDVEKIQRDCKWFSTDTVRVALNLYRSFGLIYEDHDGVLVLSDYKNLVGCETDYAEQKKVQRANKQKILSPPVDNVHTNVRQNVHTDIDIRDRYRDRDRDRDNTPPIIPPNGDSPECSVTTSKNSNEFSSVVPTHSAPEGENAQKRFRRPSVDEVRAYCQERKNAVDPQGFVDFYESKGWMVGKSPMRDWKAAVRTWERTEHERKPKAQQKPGDDMATDNIFLRMWDEEFGGKQ